MASVSPAELRHRYMQLLSSEPRSSSSGGDRTLDALRSLVLSHGVPSSSDQLPSGGHEDGAPYSLRARTWKLLLGVPDVHAEEYMALIARGPSPAHARIVADVTRTLATDGAAQAAPARDARVRLLNAFIHWGADAGLDAGYTQGLGSLAAVLLYVMPEVDAFAAFRCMCVTICPAFWSRTHAGVHAACSAAAALLRSTDTELHTHLMRVGGDPSGELLFYSRIISCYSNRPPLSQCVHVWDVILCVGVGVLVPMCVAECVARREELMGAGRGAVTRWQGVTAADSDGVGAGRTLTDAHTTVAHALQLLARMDAGTREEVLAVGYVHARPAVALPAAATMRATGGGTRGAPTRAVTPTAAWEAFRRDLVGGRSGGGPAGGASVGKGGDRVNTSNAGGASAGMDTRTLLRGRVALTSSRAPVVHMRTPPPTLAGAKDAGRGMSNDVRGHRDGGNIGARTAAPRPAPRHASAAPLESQSRSSGLHDSTHTRSYVSGTSATGTTRSRSAGRGWGQLPTTTWVTGKDDIVIVDDAAAAPAM